MTPPEPLLPVAEPDEAALLASPAMRWVRQHIAPGTCAGFLRTPAVDRFCPMPFDLDILVFGSVDAFRPERVWAPDGTPVDLAWYPQTLLAAPHRLARSGLAAHRFRCSELAWDFSGDAGQQRQAFDACLNQPASQADRIAVFLDMGYLTVREVGVTWDFPALALFWLQMGHAGCIAAIADALGMACPNVFTRPFGCIDEIEAASSIEIKSRLVRTLQLADDPAACVEPLRRIHRTVAARYSAPRWPSGMRAATRAEYAYTISADELDWRIAVALDMARACHPEAALFYLRFWAYSLARLPMVWQRAAEGEDIAFLRPERPVAADLAAHCPEIVPDLTMILGGSIGIDAVRRAIDDLLNLRSTTLQLLRSRGIPVHHTRDWMPFQPSTCHQPGR